MCRTDSHMDASVAENVEGRPGDEAGSEHKHLAKNGGSKKSKWLAFCCFHWPVFVLRQKQAPDKGTENGIREARGGWGTLLLRRHLGSGHFWSLIRFFCFFSSLVN